MNASQVDEGHLFSLEKNYHKEVRRKRKESEHPESVKGKKEQKIWQEED
jgi:hypothetical protein